MMNWLNAPMGENRALWVVSSALFLITVAVNLEAPLYPVYAQQANAGGGITAFVFALYTVALLFVLTVFGGASERVGRKTMILAGLLSSWVATALMVLFPTLYALMVARVLQGVGVGLSVGAGTAYLAELNPTRADRVAMAVGMMTALGFGVGALLTSAFISNGVTLVPFSYWLALGAMLVCGALVWRLPVQPPKGGALVRLPYLNPLVLSMGLALATAWAVTGLVIAILPLQMTKYGLGAWAGVTLFAINGTGALLQPVVRRLRPEVALKIGLWVVPIGYAVLVFGAWTGILGLILAGASLAGAGCYGFTYFGALSRVTQHTPSDYRARATSGLFMIAYSGFGFPSILIGYLSEQVGIIPAMMLFGGVIVLISISIGAWSPPPPNAESSA